MTTRLGSLAGGTGPNVIVTEVRASIEVRVRTLDDAKATDSAVRGLTAVNPATVLIVEAGFYHPPLESVERNQALWRLAYEAGRRLGLKLEEAAGGASDGNATSQHTATLEDLRLSATLPANRQSRLAWWNARRCRCFF